MLAKKSGITHNSYTAYDNNFENYCGFTHMEQSCGFRNLRHVELSHYLQIHKNNTGWKYSKQSLSREMCCCHFPLKSTRSSWINCCYVVSLQTLGTVGESSGKKVMFHRYTVCSTGISCNPHRKIAKISTMSIALKAVKYKLWADFDIKYPMSSMNYFLDVRYDANVPRPFDA